MMDTNQQISTARVLDACRQSTSQVHYLATMENWDEYGDPIADEEERHHFAREWARNLDLPWRLYCSNQGGKRT